MVALALALLAVGMILLFFVPWVGIPLGLVGLALFVAELGGLLPSETPAQ